MGADTRTSAASALDRARPAPIEAPTRPGPALVSWNLTRRCNLACSHCYLDAVQRRHGEAHELTTAAAAAVVADLADVAPGAMLVLTGGEPLLRRDLETLVRAAARSGLMVVIGTNGALLNSDRARALRGAGAAGVGISLDSADRSFHDELRGAAGAWKRALAGIEAARDAGLAVLVQTTVFEENRARLDAVAQLAESLGAIALNLFFLICTGRGVTRTDLSAGAYEHTLAGIAALQAAHPHLRIRARCAPYMRRLQGLRDGEARDGYAEWSSACLAGRRYLRITPRGEVTPCPYLPVVVGKLGSPGALRAIWDRSPLFERLREQTPGGKCGRCDYRWSCGGCRARAYAESGDPMAADPKCAYVPAAGAVPETRAGPVGARPQWSPQAHERLQRVPGFLREMVRQRLERRAAELGLATISADFVAAQRPSFPGKAPFPFGRPR